MVWKKSGVQIFGKVCCKSLAGHHIRGSADEAVMQNASL